MFGNPVMMTQKISSKPKPASRVSSKDKGKSLAPISQKPSVKALSNSKISLPVVPAKPIVAEEQQEPIQQEAVADSEFSVWFTQKQDDTPFQTVPVLKLRLGRMLDEKFHTDVVFIIGPNEEKLEAHRLILASASQLFEQLLYEAKPMSVDKKLVLYEPDYSIPTFQVFVKAIYTGEVPICLPLASALDVFYVAKKYDVKSIQKVVLEHVNQVVTTVNVFEALAVSTRMMELTSMIPTCWKIIEEQTAAVLEHHIDTMDIHTFSRILERDQLSVDEVDLFLYLIKWAAFRCKRRGLKTTARNKRQIMEPLLKLIRFTTISPKAFNERVIPTRILETTETNAIMSHVVGMDHKTVVPYNLNPRRKPQKPRQFYSGCYSIASGSPKLLSGTSSCLNQDFESESLDSLNMKTCSKTKMSHCTAHSHSHSTQAARTSTITLTDINTPRTARNKKASSKKTKGHARGQR